MAFPKVELHVHLDGALRHSTAFELLQKKNLPVSSSYEKFIESIVVKTPGTLLSFLKGFSIFLPAIIGDLEAIERISYELCEDLNKQNIIYCEVRYCPHLLLPNAFQQADFLSHSGNVGLPNLNAITTTDIVEAVNKGLKRGEQEFGIFIRSILSCIRGMPEWSQEILDLCVKFKDYGVVGIDIAGDEGGEKDIQGEENELRMLDKEDIAVFEKAAQIGIHRTVHAGEGGNALMVWKALDVLKAERIGHGYRVLEDEKIYKHCLENGVHFECCPTSSILTGAVNCSTEGFEHPIKRFSKDKASFSINTDDPTVTNTNLADEYALVMDKWGLTVAEVQQSNINAIKNAFAEPYIKKLVLDKLYSAYGMSATDRLSATNLMGLLKGE